MSVRRLEIRKEIYRDSITMLRISNELTKLEGITQAAVVMATQLNKKILKDIGFVGTDVENARSDDMVIAIEASEQKYLELAMKKADELLLVKVVSGALGQELFKTLDEAVAQMKDANMVVISVPGQFAKREALNAINKGLNVFLFSSNMDIEDELELKKMAVSRHLLMMGPDCGTSIINGVVLGFGNVLHSGPVGIVSASGTGLQQVSTLLDRQGVGISQGIGTGGNDLADSVGGLMMIEGIRLLNNDKQTKVIVLISKPPGEQTAKKVLEEVSKCDKPVVLNLLGTKLELNGKSNCVSALTLEEAANLACRTIGIIQPDYRTNYRVRLREALRREWERLAPRQKYVRGLYSGGTLCYEAQILMMPSLGDIRSNVPLVKTMRIEGENTEAVHGHHACIDMGAEEFVIGRAHPMIDFTLRNQRILNEARDPEVAVVLLDIVLGYGSNPNPSAELVPVILEAKKIATLNGGYLSVVASIIGTNRDPQQIDLQEKSMRDAGVILLPSNARAAYAAAQIAMRGVEKGE